MRNPERIDVFCTELARIWKNNRPDWRFGQFIMNVLDRDPFYLEEGDFIKRIRDFFGEPINDSRCVECGHGFECCKEDMPCAYRDAYGKCTDDCPSFNCCYECIEGDEG